MLFQIIKIIVIMTKASFLIPPQKVISRTSISRPIPWLT